MDVIACADGDVGEDAGCHPFGKGQQADGYEIHYVDVLVHWQGGQQCRRFFLLPENGRLFRFDRLAINIVVQNVKGGICLCDVPFSDDIEQFNANYLELTCQAAKTCKSTALEDYMIVGTSALPQIELGIVSGGVAIGYVLSTPADVPLFTFQVQTGILLWLSENSRILAATSLSLLLTLGIINIISNIQDIQRMRVCLKA